MKAPGRYAYILEKIFKLTNLPLATLFTSNATCEFIVSATNYQESTLTLDGWTFRSFRSGHMQAQNGNQPAIQF